MRRIRSGLLAATIVCLGACGGGGGGSGSDLIGGGGLTVTPSSLTFTFVQGGSAPPAQTLSASWTANGIVALVAGLAPGVAQPAWLPSGSGGSLSAHGGSLPIAVNPSALPAGTYAITLRVAIATAEAVVGYREVPVTLVVKSFGASASALSRGGVAGSSVAPAEVPVSVVAPAATAWTASADRPWIRLSSTAGTTPSTVTVAFVPGNLTPGTYQGTVTFSASGGRTDQVAVTLVLSAPTLTLTPPALTLGGPAGHDLSPLPLEISLDTGTAAYGWTATADVPWLDLVQLATSASQTPGTLTVRPSAEAAEWAAGVHTGAVTVEAAVNGLVLRRTAVVLFKLEPRKLVVSADGVALTSTPGLSRLSRSLRVATNRGLPATWTATSDQAWLDPTPAGTTGDALVLTADPTGLATDTLHLATVTVGSADAGLAGVVETVRVGLWVGAATPEAITIATPYTELAADPVRPWIYLGDGGGSIAVHHVHTGARVGTITVPGAALGSLAVSSDGARLYAVDGIARQVVPVDLATLTPAAGWPLPGAASASTRIAFARTNGVPLLVTTASSIHAPDTGASLDVGRTLTGAVLLSGATLAASADGTRLCFLERHVSPATLSCAALDATLTPVPAAYAGVFARADAGSNGKQVALSPDGRRAYVASGAPYEFQVVDTTSPGGTAAALPALPGAPYPVAVAVAFDGRVFGATMSSSPSVRVYDAAANPLGTFSLGDVADGGLAVSGDGLRFVAVAGGQTGVLTAP